MPWARSWGPWVDTPATGSVNDPGRLWCINRVSAAGWGGYGGRPAAESSDAVQAQRTAPSQNPEGQVPSFEPGEYDEAMQQRDSLTVWVTPESLEAWAPAKGGRRGRPTSYSDIVIETAVMLRLAMGK